MTRLQQRADELEHRARHRRWDADALRAEGYHDLAERAYRSADRLRKKEREARQKIGRKH